jgi:nitrate/nitrite transporter NarK
MKGIHMEWLLWTTVILVSMIILAITVILVASIMHGHHEYMENYRRRSALKENAIKQQREKW